MRNFIFLLIFCGATCGFYLFFSTPPPAPPVPKVVDTRIKSSGGEYFFKKILLPVDLFRQSDPRWSKDPLAWGQSGDTLGSAGCALTSVAMVLYYYGIDTEPQSLNKFLQKHDGYTPEGWLKWEVACELAPKKARFVYENVPTFKLIDSNLKSGNPVIVRLRYPNGPNGEPGITHFVVICGKEGHSYLIRDPGAGSKKGFYPLEQLTDKIEALRFYEKIPPLTVPPVV